MKYGRFSLLLLTALSIISLPAQTLPVNTFSTIPSSVDETSGLAVNGPNKIWTHNDSGGQNELYELDTLGNLNRILTILNANLVDWEELAKDDVGNFYIGDFGNNGNARTNQKIYIIPNPDSLSGDSVNAQVINLSYADQPGFPPINSRRHYDMEAMIWYQDSLFLFSKNRTNPFDGYTRMYKLPAVPGTYAVSPVDSFYTGPGPKEAYWITGADMSPSGEQLILQSYDKMWLFSCFNGSDFFGGSIQQIGLSAFGQYEGVSFLNEETLYISNETSAFGTAALNKVDISSVVITPFIDLGPDISTLNSSIMLNAGSQPNGSTYLWSNGTTGQQTTIANSGTYWVQVSNGSCTSSDTINVSFLCQGFASGVSGTNIDCFGSQNGSIDLTVVGGAPSYTYSWSTGDTVQDLNNLSAGVYSVDLSDQNGCTRQHTLTITEPAPLQINVSPIDLLCNGSPTGSIDLSVSGGTQGYTFSWSNGVTTEDLSNIPAGTYSVQIADANNCVDSISQTISEPSPIVVGITPSPTLCFGEANGSINLNVSGGTPAYRFVWSNGDTTQNISNLLAGVYAVIITDANNCPTSISDTIVNAPPIGISLSSTDASCANVDDGSIDLMVAGGIPPYNFLWSNGDTTEDLNSLGAGNFVFVITDQNGCERTDSIQISAPAPAIFSLSAQDVLCAGDSSASASVSISSGQAPYQYLWSNGDTSASAAMLPAGTLQFNLTDANGCVFTDSVDISEPDSLLITALSSTNDSTGSSGSVSVSIIGGTPPYQYNWSNGEADSSLSELSAGVYTVNVTDANGCSLTDSVEVLFSPSVSIEPQFNLRSWRVYPNPTQGQVQLELEWQQQTKANLSLLDLQGKVIEARRLPKAIKHQEKLDLSQLPAGVYIMRIQSEETSLIRRIVKQ